MAINAHQADHVEYIQDSNGNKHYLNAEYLDGHSYNDISTAISKKGTVTSVATADGITGGPITTSGTIKANLKSYTKNTAEIGGKLYGVELDKNGKLAVNVPWTDTNTDTKVTSAANHYTPAADSSAQLSVDASSTTAATWNSTSLVTGVNLQRDAKGHVTGVSVDSIKMPANPNTHQAIKTLKTDNTAAQVTSASEAIAGSGTINLHKVAKTGSYSDLNDTPTNLVTTNTEQFITGKKNFETDLNFGKYVSAVRQVSDAPANLNLMNSSQTTAGFFDTVIFAGAGDWLYLGHLKPTFSIKASFQGNGEESDTYSASLGYTRGWLDYLTDWDYQYGWCVRPAKVSTTTPAIIQIKFTNMLYTDVLRLILTGHNLNDRSGNYSGFLDDYTIEVCTDYSKDTWTTVVNRTNASDNIGKGLIYALQTGSYTTCYGIRLKITKCHVNGNGSAVIKITSMQLRDYRPGFKFPDCLGVVSQNGGDVWGALNTNNNLRTHAVFPEATNSYNLGSPTQQYYGAYADSFYENGTALSDKYLNKGTSSTVVNQVVYNPVEMKKALTVPSIRGENSANNNMSGAPLYSLGSTMATENGQATGSSSLVLAGYTGATGNPYNTTLTQTASGVFRIAPGGNLADTLV